MTMLWPSKFQCVKDAYEGGKQAGRAEERRRWEARVEKLRARILESPGELRRSYKAVLLWAVAVMEGREA